MVASGTSIIHSSPHGLNIANLCPSTRNLGPGERAVIWVQGCPFSCPGCIAPDWIPVQGGTRKSITEIARTVLSVPTITGLTISGGEPMLQASGLATLLEHVLPQRDLDVICFTGYRYANLVKDPPSPGVDRLLAQIDVLIDGPYIASKNTGIGLRGSTNQNIIHFTDRLAHVDLEQYPRDFEVQISGSEMTLIGIPKHDIHAFLESFTHMPREQVRR